jgi:D-amino-acid dehydrogenase
MDVRGSVYYPNDCRLDPTQLMHALQADLIERGCHFQFDSEVIGLAARDGRICAVRTRRGELEADEFVLAGGSWSRELVRSLGMRLPLEPGRGFSFTLPNPRQKPRHSAILVEARIAVTPLKSSLRFAGTMELAGLNPPVNPARTRGIVNAIPQFLPEFGPEDFATIEAWSGLRPCTPDGLPFVGRTQVSKNLVVATGHAMMGVSLGPITGTLVAQLIAGEPPALNIDPLSPDRYA